ncbi:MAG: hypothetical protein ACXVGG_11885 [Mycobacteriaceae bacterium]
MRTATNHASRWLFPGRDAGQPLRAETFASAIHELGVPPPRAAAPPSANSSCKHPRPWSPKPSATTTKTASRLVTEAGGTWSRYASGDHGR